MILAGGPERLGASCDSEGVNFALFAGRAERVELCLFDSSGTETARYTLPDQDQGVWHGYLPGCRPGQHYGYRAYGPYAPQKGLRFNPHKLLIDPYAVRLHGGFRWSSAVFDYLRGAATSSELALSPEDSAPCVPKSVVSEPAAESRPQRPRVPWDELVIYEANVRGFTMRHPDLSDKERGKLIGMQNGSVLAYLKALGITAIELMPVHEFIDEYFLGQHGLRNFWGYNSINFFAPAGRYTIADGVAEFRSMADAIHDAGLELILDVAYNHTGEGNAEGPTLSFRGLDNLAYYRTLPEHPGEYVNDTGCGNTVNTDHPRVQQLIVDSLRYWAGTMQVDGFRFDLATVNGRTTYGFDPGHALLQSISDDPELGQTRLIAEPWDPGPDGYQLGRFPERWLEWNDRFRDDVRQFWRGDNVAGELAKRLHGSGDIFEGSGRRPRASVNFVNSHDGFTLRDSVSYEHRHNHANGEDNRDGHSANFTCNHGVEGPTDDAKINRERRRNRLNLLATLMFSQGTPMLLAGDEFGNTQHGNNNAYAQDNETGWLDWSGLQKDRDFHDCVVRLIALRHELPLLRQADYVHDETRIRWLTPQGDTPGAEDWATMQAMILLLADPHKSASVALLMNSSDHAVVFDVPRSAVGRWAMRFCSDPGCAQEDIDMPLRLTSGTIACISALVSRTKT